MNIFSPASEEKLATTHDEIQDVMHAVLKCKDITIVCGFRNQADQDKAFESKVSKVKWPDGKHNKTPSEAVDIAPYHKKFGLLLGTDEQVARISHELQRSKEYVRQMIRNEYYYMAGIVLGVADSLGVTLRWGGDWDEDRDFTDNTFNDYMHFELSEYGSSKWRH